MKSTLMKLFSWLTFGALRRAAHRQKQYCYAALGRVATQGADPCDMCHDDNCPVRRVQRTMTSGKKED